MKRLIPHLLWILGLVLILIAVGKGSGAALPYQDPTPELIAVQHAQLQAAKALAIFGGLLVVAGIIWIIGRRFRKTSVK